MVKRFVWFIPEGVGGRNLDGGGGSESEMRLAQAGYRFTNRLGTLVFVRYAFEAEVEGYTVVLDPNEHQDFVWASEEEVAAERVGERAILLTGRAGRVMLLRAFALRREGRGGV